MSHISSLSYLFLAILYFQAYLFFWCALKVTHSLVHSNFHQEKKKVFIFSKLNYYASSSRKTLLYSWSLQCQTCFHNPANITLPGEERLTVTNCYLLEIRVFNTTNIICTKTALASDH